ncbi:hypothetical protein [Robertkochia sediminum]|uniref:hypothetical protein n=1 Tax=Robertkochia sediminum TaxID=2785326 RepID=UPI001931C3E6|nr:hypothetical protein [Robertkochia sediminum]MBL7471370.1 hypothetical protein [Robertkochia sediminum]
MHNTTLSQSLIELEENLKNLSSARSQVETVTMKTDKLVTTVAALLKNVEAIKEFYDEEKGGVQINIEKSLKSFKASLEMSAGKFKRESEGWASDQKKSVEDVLRSFRDLKTDLLAAKDEISELDFEKNFKDLQAQFEHLEQKQDLLKEALALQERNLLEIQEKQIERQEKQFRNIQYTVIGATVFITFTVILSKLI